MSATRSPGCKRRRDERGLTLIEVVVATAIFSVTVASLLVVRSRAIENTGIAKNLRTARRLGVDLLEQIHAGKEFEAGQRDFFDPVRFPGFGWRIKEVEKVEIEEKDEDDELGSGSTRVDPNLKKTPSPAAAANPLAAALLAGAGSPVNRYVVEIAYPTYDKKGSGLIQIVTYHAKQASEDAMAKMLGGLGGAASGAGGAAGALLGGKGQ